MRVPSGQGKVLTHLNVRGLIKQQAIPAGIKDKAFLGPGPVGSNPTLGSDSNTDAQKSCDLGQGALFLGISGSPSIKWG